MHCNSSHTVMLPASTCQISCQGQVIEVRGQVAGNLQNCGDEDIFLLWIKRRGRGRGKEEGGSWNQRGRSKRCGRVEKETKADDQMSMDQSSSLQPRSAARGGVAWFGKKSGSRSERGFWIWLCFCLCVWLVFRF